MASEPEGPAMETLPSEARLEEMDMVAPTKTQQASDQPSNASQQQESPSKKSQKSPPKNGIPPRRLSTATKRPVASTPASTPRSNPLSSSRNAPGNGLSKPPTRPLASSSARRPASNFAATTAASSGHKKSASINSVDKTNKSGLGILDENAKPTNSKPETRRSGYGREDSGLPKETSLQEKVKQNETSGFVQSTGSPSKSAPRSIMSSRLSVGGTTPRNARPAVSSTRRGAVGNEASRKRLSTIPASPAPAQSDSTASASASHPLSTSTPAMRPTLNSRKSTMSVTIEQRLREMELVHQMIHAAMAEDGDESDEAKEEYGRKVDESLASLRTKLEEARRNEGIADTQADNQTSETSHQVHNASETAQPALDFGELQEAFRASQDKVLLLTKEVSVLQNDLNRSQLIEKEAQRLATERGASIDNIQKMHDDAKETSQRLHDEQTFKIKELIDHHEKELIDAHNKVDDAEAKHREELANSIKESEEAKRLAVLQSSKETADSLGSQIETHKSKLQSLEHELKDEKDHGLDAASKLRNLQSEVSNLETLLSEVSAERQKLQDTIQSLDEERLRTIEEKDHDILNLKEEIRNLQSLQSSELEEIKSKISAEKSTLESEVVSLRQNMEELEKSHNSTDTAHQDELASRKKEIHGLGQVIEDFQNKMQELHEMKERDINETKHDLIQEHQKAISDFRRKHQEELAEAKTKHDQELKGVREQHQNDIESTQAIHSKEIEDIQNMLEESRSSLKETDLAKTDLLATVDSLNKRISTLVSEKEETEKVNLSKEAALKLASDETMTLQNSLEALGVESRDKEEQHFIAIQKIKDELHGKAELYATDLGAQERKSQSSLRDLQSNYDTLLATWNQAEREYPATMEKLKTEHEDAIRNHAQILDDLKDAHVKEIEASASKAESKHVQILDDLKNAHAKEIEASSSEAESKHHQIVENLKVKHEKEFSAFCKDFQEKESAKSITMQEEHDSVISDVRSRLQKQTDLLAHAEEELQIYREKENSEGHYPKGEGLLRQLEELKTQLANSQAEAAEAKAEVTRLVSAAEEAEKVLPDTTEADQLRNEISRLTTQHSAEMAKVHEHAAHENEKREKERRQGAEIRDRLAGESERMRNDLLTAQATAEEHQKALEVSTKSIQEANKHRAAAHQAAERHRSEHQKAVADLKAARAEVEQLKATKSRSEAEESRADKQELEALQIAADRERSQNAKLKEQIHEIELASERQGTKLREVECALKVTTAELVEAQTSRPNGSEYSASPAPKSGLRSSRWGIVPEPDQDGNDSTREDEERGHVVVGNMVGLQEQIRQLEDINNDMLEDEHRAMKMLSKASESAPKQKSEGSLDGIPNPVSQASLDDIEAPQPTPSKSHGEAPQQTPSKSHDEAVESPKKSSLDGEELF